MTTVSPQDSGKLFDGRRLEELQDWHLDLESIPDDLHGSEKYRRRVGAVMVARAWTSAIEEARHG